MAVARALGDLWSYNAKDDIYVVSPDPDLHVYDLNILKGMWRMSIFQIVNKQLVFFP